LISGILQFPGQFCPDAFNAKRGKKPEKHVMFPRNPEAGFQHGTALFIALFEGLAEGCPVAGYGF
jgi:hypothetical protein